MNLEFEELRNEFDASAMDGRVFSIEQIQMTDKPFVAQKRKEPDDSNISDHTFLIKRPKINADILISDESENLSDVEDFGSKMEKDNAIDESNVENFDKVDVVCMSTLKKSETPQMAADTMNEQVKNTVPQRAKVDNTFNNKSESKASVDAKNILGMQLFT